MADTTGDALQEQLAEAREFLRSANERLQGQRTDLRRKQEEIQRLRQQGVPETGAAIQGALDEQDVIERGLNELQVAVQQHKVLIRTLCEQFTTGTDGEVVLLPNTATSPTPFLLFPAGLETRFVQQADKDGTQQHELWVRVFPDTVAVDSHEAGLTDDEYSDGVAFWRDVVTSQDDEAAWQALVAVYGTTRAGWIMQQTTPTNPGAKAPEQLIFPDVPRKPDAWSEAPVCRIMPDRWVFLCYRAGNLIQQRIGNVIPEPLPIGPNPDEGIDFDVATQLLDDEANWLVNFQEAEAIGMAVRIPFADAGDFNLGFDRLVALGVKSSVDGSTSVNLVQELIDAHRFSDSFAIVPQGTPTNNTEAQRSGFASRDADHQNSLALLRGEPQYPVKGEVQDQADGQRLTTAFGLAPEALQRTANAGGQEEQLARAMMTVLWPTTLGYYLEQIMQDVVSEELIEDARQHAISWVRGRGPLAALRFGDSPYGILPVAAYNRWEAAAGSPFEDHLRILLGRLRASWQRATANLPHVNQHHQEDTLTQILGMHASSRSYGIRRGVAQTYVASLLRLQQNSLEQNFLTQFANQVNSQAQRLGIGGLGSAPGVLILDQTRHEWYGGLVQNAPLSESEPPTHNYLADLHRIVTSGAQHIIELRDDDQGVLTRGQPLLFLLLRHAALRAYIDGVNKLSLRAGDITHLGSGAQVGGDPSRELLRDPVFVDIVPGDPYRSPWSRLSDQVEGVPISEIMASPRMHPYPELLPWIQFVAGLEALRDHATSAELERLMTETLDTASHRLDAWLTSLATRRLWDMRDAASEAGVLLGGYGWLEDLRPSASPQPAPAGEVLDPNPPGPVTVDQDNLGYIHAPSINHANTAAVLYNGYSSKGSDADPNASYMAVNLSSSRVRRAAWLMDGVRQGQPLGALLGYRFERGLHEGHLGLALDGYIHAFRALYPQALGLITPSGEPRNALASPSAVNGLRLVHHWKDQTIPFGQEGLPDANAIPGSVERLAYDAIVEELEQLVDDVDALGDIGLAEGVYQLVNGNPMRAGAALGAMNGTVPPSDPDVIQVPEGGIAVTHRVMTLLPDRAPDISGWSSSTPRSLAEPLLNRWVGHCLGDPTRILLRVTVTAMVSDVEQRTDVDIDLSALGVAPLDLLYMSGLEGDAGATELEQRIAYHVLLQHAPGARAEIHFGRQSDWRPEDLSLGEVLELLRRLRDLVTTARPLEPADMALPGSDQDDAALFAQQALHARAQTARDTLRTYTSNLEHALEGLPFRPRDHRRRSHPCPAPRHAGGRRRWRAGQHSTIGGRP